MEQSKFQKYFKNIAIETAKLSTCISKQVGALLVKDKRILAIGYNGTPKGTIHCNTLFTDEFDRDKHHKWSERHELHAEQNLIAYCSKNGIHTNNCILYITISPCINCAKLILASGITKVYYMEKYDLSPEGITFLKENGINVYKL